MDDLTSAYRRVPTSEPEFTIVAIFNPDLKGGSTCFCEVYGHNFGLRSAVTNFSRVPALLVATARRVLACMTSVYIDDYITPELLSASGSGQESVAFIHNMANIPLSNEKRKRTAPQNIVLGVNCDMSEAHTESYVMFQPRESKVNQVLDMIASIVDQNSLDSVQAGILCGKIGHILSSAHGRLGRAVLQPISARKQEDITTLTVQILEALKFFRVVLRATPPMKFNIRPKARKPVLVYSDASSAGSNYGLGLVVVDTEDPQGTPIVSSSRCPHWIIERLRGLYGDLGLPGPEGCGNNSFICPLELLAAIAVSYTCPRIITDREIIHFIDNTSALSCVVYGTSGSPAMARLSNIYHLRLWKLNVNAWHEWVPSLANIADIPSRACWDECFNTEILDAMHPTRVEMKFPSEREWEDVSAIFSQ
jgi:hypothetical protein